MSLMKPMNTMNNNTTMPFNTHQAVSGFSQICLCVNETSKFSKFHQLGHRANKAHAIEPDGLS